MRRRSSLPLGPLRLLAALATLLLAFAPAASLAFGAPAAASPAAAAAASQPFQQENDGVIDDTSYESPEYGYTVTWESPWEVGGDTVSGPDGDVLALTADGAQLRLTGNVAEGEPADLLESTIASLQEALPQLEVVTDERDAAIPSAVLEGRTNSILLEVRTVADSNVADSNVFVLVSLQVPTDAIDDALTNAESVLVDGEPIFTDPSEGGEATPEADTDTDTETATETETDSST